MPTPAERRVLVLEGVVDSPWCGCDCHTTIVEIDGVNLAHTGLMDLAEPGRRLRITVEEIPDADA